MSVRTSAANGSPLSSFLRAARISTKPQNPFTAFRSNPAGSAAPSAVVHSYSKTLSEAKQVKQLLRSSKRVTRRHYPAIVELKTAGRSDRQIADRFGLEPRQMKVHITRAMREFREGDVDPNEGNAVLEAKKVGEEKGAKFQSDLAGAYSPSGQPAALVAPPSVASVA